MTASRAGVSIRVLESFGAVVQDLGRVGHEKGGINRSGASDTFSSRFANLAIGNRADAPCVEITGTRFAFETAEAVTIAVTGAGCEVRVDEDVRIPQWEPVTVPRGARVDIGLPTAGYRVYLALAGGLRARSLYGSVSPLPPFGFLNEVRAGDELSRDPRNAGSPVAPGSSDLARPFVERTLGAERIGVIETAQTAMFEGMERLYSHQFTMSPRSNPVGARFAGPTPVRKDNRELVSRSVPIGSIEIPSAGELIALLRGRLITAGYPVPAVIARADIDVVAQLAPGARVGFERIDESEARYRLMQTELVLQRLAGRDTSRHHL
ncbi:biotin-dependent carboxyltransferase family protein [Brooklawnia cerclae]|uniref:Antagonist of KipI n=1 Tax=Brooklawnia cerclae TaxID=349934 RepID=A0ABX0SLH8_9ACTN|nr:biotin-dependent carboxyltransferase family protein [Brooklawnia cerclae]NIH57606.1 antagonist of KipI [Brooklawnia cerclae]